MSVRFDPVTVTAREVALRSEIRAFVAEEMARLGLRAGLGLDSEHSPEFSAALGARGWLGMGVPPEYGGQGRGAVDRFIVVEELLAVGAPVMAHWVADRQTAQQILRFGTEEQRRRFLPEICAGRCFFSIGMSEPDSGSDLASVRTTATRVDGGWLVNGTKIWTSTAHLNHWFAVLCRTSPAAGGDRHSGLSQLLVDLRAPGVQVRPIELLNGRRDFSEVVLVGVGVPDDLVLGAVGDGWKQVTSELGFERSGPDRWLSTFRVLRAFVGELDPDHLDPQDAAAVGALVARCWGIRNLSLSIAQAIDAGRDPAVEAAAVKDLGTRFEQDVVETLRYLSGAVLSPDDGSAFERLLAEAMFVAPGFTVRGGTTEIMHSIVAKGL